MKNIITTLSIFFVLGSSIYAQKAKTTKPAPKTETTIPTTHSQSEIDVAAQKDLNNLTAVLNDLSSEKQQAFKQLFVSKHEMISGGLSNERKKALAESMEYRFSLLLDPAALAKLKADQKLYNSLIN